MISLTESWRTQRQQRRYEVMQRQQQVHEILEQFQQARQVKAAELREDLQLFQLELQLDTQEFLSQAQSQRQVQAEQLMQQLHRFTQALRQQTADLMATNAADRTVMSQQLTQELSEFHTDLNLSVILLRQDLQQQMQDLQIEVQAIRTTTQELLQDYQQERIQKRMQQIPILKAWTEKIQIEVQDYLSELSLIRHDRAYQLQTMLRENADRRHAEVSELFQQLGQFRSDLKTYCTELHQVVWGETAKENVAVNDANNAKITQKRPAGIPQAQKHRETSAPPTSIPPISVPPTSVPQSNGHQSNGHQSNGHQNSKTAKQQAKRLAAHTAKRLPAPQSAKPKPLPEPLRTGAVQAPNLQPASHSSANVLPQLSLTDPIEQQVYTHLQQTHGARLTEIETVLTINRFQAVDALRALIKKGLVTQRDRIYLIQEEMSL